MKRKLTGSDIYPDWPAYQTRLTDTEQFLSILDHLGTPFTTRQGNRFLSHPIGAGCSQTLPFRHPSIRSSVVREFVDRLDRLPKEATLRAASRAFQAKATRDCRSVTLRIGNYSGNIHFDPAWSDGPLAGKHIEITPYGWNSRTNRLDTVLPSTAAPHPQVDPHRHTPPDPLAALDPLRQLLRLQNDRPAWLRVLVWLFAAFRPPASPDTPRDLPILQISGPPGSGKTSAARMLRTLVDPNDAPITFTPSNEAAAGRIARDNHVFLIDGTTRLARRPAEVLARLSTGLPAKFHGEMQNISRPILITTNEAGAADRLSHRVLPIDLPALENPLPPEELKKRFEALRPAITGAILTILSTALRRLPGTPCPEGARFPEALQWAIAGLDTLDPKELFCVTRPQNNFEAGISDLVNKEGGEWKGTASELAKALNSPLSARALSVKLDEISAVCVTKSRTGRLRTITLTQNKASAVPTDIISASHDLRRCA